MGRGRYSGPCRSLVAAGQWDGIGLLTIRGEAAPETIRENRMAGSVNKVILIGNLGRDPEVRYTPNGNAICNISVATTRNWKDKTSGDKVELARPDMRYSVKLRPSTRCTPLL